MGRRPTRTDDHPDATAPVVIVETPVEDADVRWCFERYAAELDARFEGGFRVEDALPLDRVALTPPRGLVLIARDDGRPVGCGALRLTTRAMAEIKRVWVAPEARGRGVATRLMDELEDRAAAAGRRLVRLDTNHSLTEAIAMYRRRGYREIGRYNEERYADRWFEKALSVDHRVG